jgi:transposase
LGEDALAPDQKGALQEDATLVFWDEAGFSQRPSVRRTWAPRGRTPVLKQPFNWKRLSAIGMIAYRPASDAVRVLFSLGPGNVDSDWVVRGLRSLRRHLSGAVILLWDGLPAHRSAHTRRHVQAQHRWLQLERLPAYTPELNPVEAMWANLSARELANLCPETLDELATHVRRGVRRLRRHVNLGYAFLKHSGLFPEL